MEEKGLIPLYKKLADELGDLMFKLNQESSAIKRKELKEEIKKTRKKISILLQEYEKLVNENDKEERHYRGRRI